MMVISPARVVVSRPVLTGAVMKGSVAIIELKTHTEHGGALL
jgi:hypothetical protein